VVIPDTEDWDHTQELAWRQEHYPCDTGCTTTGHLIPASLLCWLLRKTLRKAKKHTVPRNHNSLLLLPQPTRTLMTRVLYSSSNTLPSRTSDHNNLISSRYLLYMKHALALQQPKTIFLHSEISVSKQSHVQYYFSSIRCKYSNCEKDQKGNPC